MIHILVVDDDEKLNKTICTWLNDCGFETKGVLGAKEAYDELYNSLYDLIVSDIMMPEIDGFEFARNVREVNKHIPILFMSAKDDLPSKQKGFQLGIDDYMVKPVELAELEMRGACTATSCKYRDRAKACGWKSCIRCRCHDSRNRRRGDSGCDKRV